MANGGKKRGFVTYKSYMFREKDPIIDACRTAHGDAKMSYEDIHKEGGPATSTIYNWFHGKTRRPQFATIAAFALTVGKKGIMFRGGKPHLVD